MLYRKEHEVIPDYTTFAMLSNKDLRERAEQIINILWQAGKQTKQADTVSEILLLQDTLDSQARRVLAKFLFTYNFLLPPP